MTTMTEPAVRRWTNEEYHRMGDAGFFKDERVELIHGEIWLNTDQCSDHAQLKPHSIEPIRLWTRDEYYRLGELGFFDGQRVELIAGEIFVMSPQHHRHFECIDRIADVLKVVFGASCWVRLQGPIHIMNSDPEPDVSVVKGNRKDYTEHPTMALLAVEASSSSLDRDHVQKTSLYASAGILDYWIVNLIDRQLEVFREPVRDAALPFGWNYASRTVLHAGDTVSPLAAPQSSIPVADLLPRMM